mgnify:FL=1|jgi:hypothetical protein
MIHLEIYQHRKISALQADFNAFFPFLLLELYYKEAPRSDHSKHAHLQKEHFAHKTRDLIEACTVNKKEGLFAFDPQITAKDFKNQLANEFGLNCEIYHRVGKNEWSTFPVDGAYQLDEAPFQLH